MPRPTDLTRRRLLALTTASTAALAGCSDGGDGDDGSGGDGGDDGDDGDGSSDGSDGGDRTETDVEGDTATADQTAEPTADETTTETVASADDCTAFEPESYARFDGAGEAFVATFEYPAGEGSGTIQMGTVNGVRSASIIQDVRGERFYVFFEQDLEGTEERSPADRGETDGFERFDALTFGGEDVPLVRSTSPGQFEYTVFAAGLPYEHDDGSTRYYHVEVNATAAYADSAEAGECEATWRATAEHVLRSLEPNPDTTIEEERR